jgi:anti-sigma-K factor RskA
MVMKEDKLDFFIRRHKADMEEDFDSELHWQQVAPKVQGRKVITLWRTYAVAASLMLLMAVGMILVSQKKPASQKQIVLSKEVMQAQMEYATLIEIKRSELKAFKAKEPELCREFDMQLVELDHMYQDLLPQLRDENKQALVLPALIENLQMQLNILDQQLEIVQQLNAQK